MRKKQNLLYSINHESTMIGLVAKGKKGMNDSYISITELAKLRKVSSETLRYYDRVGLLKPAYIDPQTRYRYYTIRQSEELGVIRELRDLGMSIEEIQNYLEDCNLEKSVQMLSQYYSRLQDDIERNLRICRNISKKLAYLGGLTSLKGIGSPYIKHFPERYMLTFGNEAGGPNKHTYVLSKLEGYLNDLAPVLAKDCVGIYAGEELLEQSENYVYGTPMVFVDKDDIKPEAHEIMRTIPEGDYVCLDYHGGRLEKYDPCFEKVKKCIKNNKMVVNGLIYQVYKIDVTLTQNRDETLMEIQVPVANEL